MIAHKTAKLFAFISCQCGLTGIKTILLVAQIPTHKFFLEMSVATNNLWKKKVHNVR